MTFRKPKQPRNPALRGARPARPDELRKLAERFNERRLAAPRDHRQDVALYARLAPRKR